MEIERKIVIAAGIIALVIIVLILIQPDELEEVDFNCLNTYAVNYCSDLDLQVNRVGANTFNCMIEEFPRDRTIETTKNFYYLNNERRFCD